MSDSRRPRSVSRVPARAPGFDELRVELGIIVVIAVSAAFVTLAVDAAPWVEVLTLAAIGMACGGWVAARSARLVRRAQDRESGNGP